MASERLIDDPTFEELDAMCRQLAQLAGALSSPALYQIYQRFRRLLDELEPTQQEQSA